MAGPISGVVSKSMDTRWVLNNQDDEGQHHHYDPQWIRCFLNL